MPCVLNFTAPSTGLHANERTRFALVGHQVKKSRYVACVSYVLLAVPWENVRYHEKRLHPLRILQFCESLGESPACCQHPQHRASISRYFTLHCLRPRQNLAPSTLGAVCSAHAGRALSRRADVTRLSVPGGCSVTPESKA